MLSFHRKVATPNGDGWSHRREADVTDGYLVSDRRCARCRSGPGRGVARQAERPGFPGAGGQARGNCAAGCQRAGAISGARAIGGTDPNGSASGGTDPNGSASGARAIDGIGPIADIVGVSASTGSACYCAQRAATRQPARNHGPDL